jgi:DNA-binding cell septation regulator SpoVG
LHSSDALLLGKSEPAIHHLVNDFKEESMKILLMALPLMFIAISCNNKDAGTEFKQQKEEVNKEYRESVQDASQQRSEEIGDAAEERSEELEGAREDLKEHQKEEATEYVEESDGARIDRSEQEVEVIESQDQ